jgi:lincosamide nucleotidyltransferase
LIQREMIESIKRLCRVDPDLLAAMMYGSFAKGGGDRYSDIEFVLFFRDAALPHIDRRAWLGRIAPVEILYTNEYSITVAIFDSLVRGEFHFEGISDVAHVGTWGRSDPLPSVEDALVVDKTGALLPHLEKLVVAGSRPRPSTEEVSFFGHSFINWLIFGLNLLHRQDHAHALNILWMVQRYLLSMARTVEGALDNLVNPTKNLDQELSPDAVTRYAACTSDVTTASLHEAYQSALDWGLELIGTLEARYGTLCSERLKSRLVEFAAELDAG